MATGIKIEKKSFMAFDTEMKKGKKFQFMLFQLNKKMDKVVLVDKEKGDKKLKPTYDDFVKALCVDGQPRWGVFQYEAKKKDGSFLDKFIMITWCQDTAPLRKKMVHGSTHTAVKDKLSVDKVIQASTTADVEESIIREKLGLGKKEV
mmetsp:Transcript_18224/g.29071  ORF Transcript_18224/g.29071 Transcript_18224/m.29071 type:complete len:148 (+) Transcript_18224:64-507(+)